MEFTADKSLRLKVDTVEATIDAIRSNFMPEGKVNINLEYGVAFFATGQDFWTGWQKRKNRWMISKKGRLCSNGRKEENIRF